MRGALAKQWFATKQQPESRVSQCGYGAGANEHDGFLFRRHECLAVLFEVLGYVDRVAYHCVIHAFRGANIAGDNRTRMDADADANRSIAGTAAGAVVVSGGTVVVSAMVV